MKTTHLPPFFPIALAVALFAVIPAGLNAADDCAGVASRVKSQVRVDPTKVLVVIEDAITTNESCACEIVKTAITATDADKALVKQIVITAVNAAPSQVATISECAVAVAPEAAAEVRAGVEEVLGGYGYGKAPIGKAPIAKAPIGKAYGPVRTPVTVYGVYMLAPIGPSAPLIEERVKVIVEKRPASDKKKIIRITPASPSGLTTHHHYH